MMSFDIMLNTINDVKEFVNIVMRYDFEIDLVSGRYAIDAKSIMGIFSLDLSKPMRMDIHTIEAGKLIDEIKKFMVEK